MTARVSRKMPGDELRREPLRASGKRNGAVSVVATEQFVPAVTAQCDLDRRSCLASEVVCGQRGRVGERRAEDRCEFGQILGRVRTNAKLVVRRPQVTRD